MKQSCPVCGVWKVGLADHLRDKHGQTGPQAFQSLLLVAPPSPPRTRTARSRKPSAEVVNCGDCGAKMVLKGGIYGLFYSCTNWPGCRGAHGAHPDGKPMGIPADYDTRKLRQAAHSALESTWSPGGRQLFPSRTHAYEWVQAAMGLTATEAHIARFDAAQCKKLIEALWAFDEAYQGSPAP